MARDIHRRGRALLAPAFAWALATCGGTTAPTAPAPTPVSTPAPAPVPVTLADLSATVTSPQADQPVNCVDQIRMRVTLTNRGATGVAVTGVLNSTSVVTGDCFTGDDFTYRVTQIVFANTTAVLLDQPMYSGPNACCLGSRLCAGSCIFRHSLQVITEVGRVPAGSSDYRTYFQNCPACPSAAAAGVRACPAPARGRP